MTQQSSLSSFLFSYLLVKWVCHPSLIFLLREPDVFKLLFHRDDSAQTALWHPSYPGMPMVPRASDSDKSCGQSGMIGVRSAPSLTVWVLQPPRPITWLPTGNAGFLLWSTLQKKTTATLKLEKKCGIGQSQDTHHLGLCIEVLCGIQDNLTKSNHVANEF